MIVAFTAIPPMPSCIPVLLVKVSGAEIVIAPVLRTLPITSVPVVLSVPNSVFDSTNVPAIGVVPPRLIGSAIV